MIADDVLQYSKQLIESMHHDYPYYVMYTNTNVDYNSNLQNQPYAYIVFSSEPIIANSRYNYTVTDGVRYAIKRTNASYNYHDERIVVTTGITTVSIDNYEYVYTNAEFTGYAIQPDITANNNIKSYEWQGFAMLIALVVISVIFYKLIKR